MFVQQPLTRTFLEIFGAQKPASPTPTHIAGTCRVAGLRRVEGLRSLRVGSAREDVGLLDGFEADAAVEVA